MPVEMDSCWFDDDELEDYCSDLEDRQVIRDAQSDVNDHRELSRDDMQVGFDTDCYYISRSAKQGIITCRLRKREEIRMATAIVAARSELRKIAQGKFLYNSVSFTLSLYPLRECLRLATEWMHWHRHWVYGAAVGVELSDIYPTRAVLQRRVTGIAEQVSDDCRSKSSWENSDSCSDIENDVKDSDASQHSDEISMSIEEIVDDDFELVKSN